MDYGLLTKKIQALPKKQAALIWELVETLEEKPVAERHKLKWREETWSVTDKTPPASEDLSSFFSLAGKIDIDTEAVDTLRKESML